MAGRKNTVFERSLKRELPFLVDPEDIDGIASEISAFCRGSFCTRSFVSNS